MHKPLLPSAALPLFLLCAALLCAPLLSPSAYAGGIFKDAVRIHKDTQDSKVQKMLRDYPADTATCTYHYLSTESELRRRARQEIFERCAADLTERGFEVLEFRDLKLYRAWSPDLNAELPFVTVFVRAR